MGTLAQAAVAAVAFAAVAGLGWGAPRVLRSASPLAVALACAAAIVGALVADSAATGVDAYDGALRVLGGLAFVAAGTCATARPRLAAAVVLSAASVLGSGDAWTAAVALGISVGLVLLGTDGAAVGAWTGFALGQAALRLDWPAPTGASAVVAAGALAILAVSALGHVHRRTRRRVLLGGAVVVGVGVMVGGAWGVTALSVRDDLSHAVDVANAALDSARAGDTETAAAQFDEARALFARAGGRLDGWWAQPIRMVPIAAPNARALREMTDAGRALSIAGATTVRSADPDAVKPVDGEIPLDQVRALDEPLADVAEALTGARVRLAAIDSPWLVGALSSKLHTLDDKIERGIQDAAIARVAVEVVPRLLGGDGERRYFVAFQTPAELRGSGGIIGNFAEITYRDGRMELVRNARNDDYNASVSSGTRTLVAPADYVRRYGIYDPEYVIQSVTLSPDFPSVARVIEGVYPQTGASPVDGVISFDPLALAELLRLTGNVEVPGFGLELTPDNAADILLREQYVRFPDLDDRVEFLKAAVGAVFDRFGSGDLPGPSRIGEVLGPMARQGRIQLHSTRADEQAFFRRIGVDGALPAVGGGDFLGVVTQNAAGNKIDVFQRRATRYEVEVDPETGAVAATARITVHNDAPASGLPDYVIGSFPDNPLPRGTSRVMVSVYTPLRLVASTVAGESAALLADTERGRNVYTAQVDIPPGGRRELVLRLEGAVDRAATGDRYRLRLWHQATVTPDRTRVAVRAAPGWSVVPIRGLRATADGAAGRFTVSETLSVVAGFEPG